MTRGEHSDASPQLRLFVAIELPDPVRNALAEAIAMLKRAGIGEGLRWPRPEGIHLTLKFLGATPPDGVPAIVSALDAALDGVPRFKLQPCEFGAFHGGKGVVRGHPVRETYHYNLRVLWVGLDGATDQLAGLASRVDAALAPLGYAAEKRPFFAHLTLARVRENANRPTREAMGAALRPYLSRGTRGGDFQPELVPPFPAFTVDRVSLMQSTLQPGGAIYRALHTVPLSL